MAGPYVVSGPVAVLPTNDGSERYMYRGALITDKEFTEDGIKHGLSIGLLSKAPKPAEEAPTEPEVVTIPEGDPSDEWTVKQLTAYAGTLSIDLGTAKSKPEILASITAAK